MYLNSVSVSYNITYMKHIFLLLILILATAQANLGSFDSNGKFIYPETNQPFTGNLDVINNDWAKDAPSEVGLLNLFNVIWVLEVDRCALYNA